MQKASVKRILSGFLHLLFGSVLCAVLTISMAPVITNDYALILAVLFAFLIFYSIIFTAGYRDGLKDARRAKIHTDFAYPKHRWLKIGVLLYLLMFALCMLLAVDVVSWHSGGYYVFFKFACSLTYPLLLLLDMGQLENLPLFMPFVLTVYFIPIPFAAQFGYKMGFSGRLENKAYQYK